MNAFIRIVDNAEMEPSGGVFKNEVFRSALYIISLFPFFFSLHGLVMKHDILVAGKPALAYAKDGVSEYSKRLKRYGQYQIQHLKDGSSEDVSKRLHDASTKSLRIVLDERGKQLTTEQFFQQIQAWEMQGQKRASYLIGASDGHTEELRQQADLIWALSPLTLQHELALVVLLEQLYRVATMQRGEPYHR